MTPPSEGIERCAVCHKQVPDSRRDKRFCSTRCNHKFYGISYTGQYTK